MRDQDLKAFSEEVKRGFVEALGDKSSFSSLQVIRFFTDDLTGDECAIVYNGSEEICVTADEAYDIEAKAQAKQDAYELQCEIE
jgi:hypothetical protein